MKSYFPLLIVISLILFSLSGCREKGTPFSFTTPEGEEVSFTIPPGFEDQRVAKPWKKVFPEKDYTFQFADKFAAYIYRGNGSKEVMELYFILSEDSGTTKKWSCKPENRGLYDYIEYPDSNFICVAQIEYISDPYILSLGMYPNIDSHSAHLYLNKQILDISLCFHRDSLMTERAKEVMNALVKSLKITRKK